MIDTTSIRSEFPILQRRVGGKPIVYLDSAATSLKPRSVIAAIVDYYERYTANINRGVHLLAEEATDKFEDAREIISSFINADMHAIVFVRNTTEAINLVAHSLPAEAPVLYGLDAHHSNLVPWQRRPNAVSIRVLPDGSLDLNDLREKLAQHRPELVAVTHVSNAFGAMNPVEEIVSMAQAGGAKVLVDASQSVPHREIDVLQIGCDFLCFSGHKMCGPTGIGVLYGKREHLEAAPPLHYGGDMVETVHADQFQIRDVPWRFEAGTPYIEGAIGLAAACEFLESVGMANVARHEHELVREAAGRLREVPGIEMWGPAEGQERSGAITFSIEGIESHGVSRALSNRHNICVRSGFHCAQPAHESLGASPTVRASFYLYNNSAEVDLLTQALHDLTSNLMRAR